MNPESLTQIGKYQVQEFMTAGTVGPIFKARAPELDETFALKLIDLQGDQKSALDNFLRIMHRAKVDSPALAKHHEAFLEPQTQHVALVSEFVDGLSLAEWIESLTLTDQRRLSPTTVALITEQFIRSIQAIHNFQLVHQRINFSKFRITQVAWQSQRDFCEQNGLIQLSELEDWLIEHRHMNWLKLVDWQYSTLFTNPAMPVQLAARKLATLSHEHRVEQFAFLAPEAIMRAIPTEKVDIFALSLVAYQLLTDQPALCAREITESIDEEQLDTIEAFRSQIANSNATHCIDYEQDDEIAVVQELPRFASVLQAMSARAPDRRPSAKQLTTEWEGIIQEALQVREEQQKAQHIATSSAARTLTLVSISLSLLIVLTTVLLVLFSGPPDVKFSSLNYPEFSREQKVTIKGICNNPNVSLQVNGLDLVIGTTGQFSHQLELSNGKNTLNFSHKSEPGKSILSLTIYYDTEAPTPQFSVKPVTLEEYPDFIYFTNSNSELEFKVINEVSGTATLGEQTVPIKASQTVKLPVSPAFGPKKYQLKIIDAAGNTTTQDLLIATPDFMALKSEVEAARHGQQQLLKRLKISRDDESRVLLPLLDLQQWSQISQTKANEAAKLVETRLNPEIYQFIGVKLYRCGDQRFFIPQFQHKERGIYFSLIPGGVETMTIWRDPRAPQTILFLDILSGPFNERALLEFIWFTPPLLGAKLVQNLYSKFRDQFKRVPAGTSEERMKSFAKLFAEPKLHSQLQDWARKMAASFRKTQPHTTIHIYCEPGLVSQSEVSAAQMRTNSQVPLLLDRLKSRVPTLKTVADDVPAIVTYGELEEWLETAKSNFRLPTIWEWRHLCRAGSKADYFWGSDPSKRKTYVHSQWLSPRLTDIQGIKLHETQTNAFGLSDTIGNAYEWCAVDWNFWAELWPNWKQKTKSFQSLQEKYDIGVLMGGQFRSGSAFISHDTYIISDKIEERATPRKGFRLFVSIP